MKLSLLNGKLKNLFCLLPDNHKFSKFSCKHLMVMKISITVSVSYTFFFLKRSFCCIVSWWLAMRLQQLLITVDRKQFKLARHWRTKELSTIDYWKHNSCNAWKHMARALIQTLNFAGIPRRAQENYKNLFVQWTSKSKLYQ